MTLSAQGLTLPFIQVCLGFIAGRTLPRAEPTHWIQLAAAGRPAGSPASAGAWGEGGMDTMPPGGVKTAEGGVAPATRSLDDRRSPGGRSPPAKTRREQPKRGHG
jgi:hypothetical protein